MYQSQRDNLLAVIRILAVMVFFLGIVILIQSYLYRDANQHVFVDIPAHSGNGTSTEVEIGVMQKTSVYDFTQRTFQSLHRWKYDGAIEYEKNIRAFEDVLTPDYMAFLRRDQKRRKGNQLHSELTQRTRVLLPLLTGWDENRVKEVATKNGKPSAWVVLLDMELIEKYKGETIKHLYLRYPIRVVLFDSDRNRNPWMSALDGYQQKPEKLSLELEKEKSS